MALILLLIGSALVIAGVAIVSVPWALISAGLLLMLGSVAFAAAQERAPAREPAE